jgi:hypothetical protein
MKHPDEITLSHEDGEALRQRLNDNALTVDDRRVLDQVLLWYFWLVFALQEAKMSLRRLRHAGVWEVAHSAGLRDLAGGGSRR